MRRRKSTIARIHLKERKHAIGAHSQIQSVEMYVRDCARALLLGERHRNVPGAIRCTDFVRAEVYAEHKADVVQKCSMID